MTISEDEAYWLGVAAYYGDYDLEDNPFSSYSQHHQYAAWIRGWKTAFIRGEEGGNDYEQS